MRLQRAGHDPAPWPPGNGESVLPPENPWYTRPGQSGPHGVVAALVEGKGLIGVGDIALPADGVEGIAVGGIEIEEKVLSASKAEE